MSVSAVSFYRGGTVEDVTPLAKKMREVLRKYDVSYQVSRFKTCQDLGDWMVVVRYADWATYEKVLDLLGGDPEHRQVVAEISKLATFVNRQLVVDLDL